MTDKLTRRERERIIFDYLKGKPNPLYDVEETCHGKYVVKPKPVQIEEESEPEEPPKPIEQPKQTKQQLKRERRRANRRAKADAYKILEQLNRLINANNESNDSSSDDGLLNDEKEYPAPRLVEQPNLDNQPVIIRRKRLRF